MTTFLNSHSVGRDSWNLFSVSNFLENITQLKISLALSFSSPFDHQNEHIFEFRDILYIIKLYLNTISLKFNLKSELLFISLGIGHTVPLYSKGGTNRSAAHAKPNKKNIIFAYKLTNFTNLFLFHKTAANFARPNFVGIQFVFIVHLVSYLYRKLLPVANYFKIIIIVALWEIQVYW